MRFPERTKRKWGRIAYVIEWCAVILHYLGITIFVIITLYQVRGFLETGSWPWMPMRLLFIDHLELGFFTDPAGWYAAPADWKGLRTVLWFFMERVPVSLLFLAAGRYLSFSLLWLVDRWMPEKLVEQKPLTPGQKKVYMNIK